MGFFEKGLPDAPTLADLLRIEAAPEFATIICPVTGIPLWSQGRTVFYRLMMADLFYEAPIPGRLDQSAGIARAVWTMGRSILRNGRFRLGGIQAPILIKGDAVTDRLADGRWYNPIADAFGDATPGCATFLYDHYAWRWPFPRHDENVRLLAPLQARHALLGALDADAADHDRAQRLVDLAAARAARLTGWELGSERRARLVRYLAHKSAILPRKYRDYGRLLDRAGCRLLLVSEGCYGHHAPAIAAAKDRHILTAEYQHAAVTAGHDAYNFGEGFRESAALRRALPEVFLSHGRWWEAQINAPVEMATIGHPARRRDAAVRDVAAERRSDILVLSDGIDFAEYAQLANHISRRLANSGFRVVLRPHPIERASVLRAHGDRVGEVAIEAAGDIYDAFGSAKVVISEVSTGLFEAYGLVDHIWVLATPKSKFSVPNHPFDAIADLDDMESRLSGLRSGPSPYHDPELLWAKDWKGNYRRFLSERGVLNQCL